MGASERRKGAQYEREVCDEIFAWLGLNVQRKLGQERDSGNDIDLPLAVGGKVRLECKRRGAIANLWSWLDQVQASCDPADVPAVVMRADGWKRSLVVIDLPTFLQLVREELEFKKEQLA